MSNWELKEHSVGDLTVTIDGEKWRKATVKALNKIAKNIRIDGFRPGQAPKSMVERMIRPDAKYEQAVNDNCNEWMREAFEELDLTPISQPQLDVKEADETHAVLVYTFAVMPEAKVMTYKGLPYEKEEVVVTDEDIDGEINRMRDQYKEMQVKEETAEDGDTVNIDYVGYKDEIPFDGGAATGFDLKLGSGQFIPGFEEQLIGAKAGEEKELNLTFPEDYHAEDLAGAAVVFKVTVNEVKTEVLPEVNDDFAQDMNIPDVETLEQLKQNIRERLEKQRNEAAESKADNDLMEAFADAVDVDLPDALIEDETQQLLNQFANQIQQWGMSLTSYMEMMNLTTDSLKEQYREQAVNNLNIRLGLQAVAKAENLVPDDAEIEAQYAEMSSMYGMEVDELKKYIRPEDVKADLANQKAFELIRKNADGYVEDAVEETTTEAEAAE